MISVVVTTHDWNRFKYLIRAVEHVPEAFEVVGAFEDEGMADAFRDLTDHESVFDPSIDGLSAARNAGTKKATGEIYAFIDDDVIPGLTWAETMEQLFEDGAIAAGGPAVPFWPLSRRMHQHDGHIPGRPWFVPELWDWLIGCGPYHDKPTEIRNTYGCNIAFKAEIFEELGGFDTSFGKAGDLGQAEETELCRRMFETYGKGVNYHPDMKVQHRIFDEQLDIKHLLIRAHEQGRVKARLGLDSDESSFLTEAIRSLIPPNSESIASSLYLAATGTGYIRGLTSRSIYWTTAFLGNQ